MAQSTYDTLIVGAGFTGIGTAIKLIEAGVDDFVILDRSDRVGGTWRDNTYPGAACDIPSLLYSFSFVKNPDWSRAYSPAGEIRQHIEDMVDPFDLRRRIQFGVEVNGSVVRRRPKACGRSTPLAAGLNAPHVRGSGRAPWYWPPVPCPTTSGPTSADWTPYEGHKIHSANWDHDYDFTGKRVAVIGTGASAVQIIPKLVKTAGFVKVFQRTPGWVIPRLDIATPPAARTLFTKVPAVQQLARQILFWGHEASATAMVWDTPLTGLVARVGKAHLRRQVSDPWLRRQLTPDFTPGCKRMLVSSDYYPALQRDNCKLIDWPIATMSPVGIRTSDGIEHHLDAIVFATGFDVHLTGPPYPVTGLGGRSLADEWKGGAQAYKSINAHGYPNLFLMTGPNSGPGHNSLLVYVEGQIDYAVTGISTILRKNLRYLDVRADVQQRHNTRLQQRLTKTTWMSGCTSWYLTADGFNASMYPGTATQYLRQMRDFRLGDYDVTARDARVAISSSA